MDFRSHLIFHLPSIVLDNEGVLFSLRFLVERILFVNVVELVQKIFVTATRKATKTQDLVAVTQVSQADTHLQESSRMHSSPVGLDSKRCKQPELSRNSISVHLMPSRLYSFCSYLKTC